MMEIDLNQPASLEQENSTAIIMLENFSSSNKKKNLSMETKRSIVAMLLEESDEGRLNRGAVAKVANLFSVSTRSLSHIWHEAKNLRETTGVTIPEFSSKLIHRVGRKRVQVAIELVRNLHLRQRSNIRSLASAIEASKSTVHRRIKAGYIKPHTNAVKPYLMDENKKKRWEFCLSMIDICTIPTKPTFLNMYDRIHIDEKWFYITKTSKRIYILHDEQEPYRTCKSKSYITKIMFMTAVARPLFDANTKAYFDGKIGIWPFVYKEAAKRRSKNRVAETLETKPILSVNKDVIRSCLIEKVLPAIRQKWPTFASKTVFIQQDNAKPHIGSNDPDFAVAAIEDGFDIRLCCQPPNSPDLNILDLGFFRAIDTIQHQEPPTTIDEFVAAVEKAFVMFPSENINNVFLTLQSCMVEVLRNLVGNNYKIPHMYKENLIRNEQLPECISFDNEILNGVEAANLGSN